MLLPHLITEAASREPTKDAVVFRDARISFGLLEEQSNQVAARMQRLGIGRGTRVALLYETSLAAVVFFWGILKTGAQVVDVPSLSGLQVISSILSEARPEALVISDRQWRRLNPLRPNGLPSTLFTGSIEALPDCSARCHLLPEIVGEESKQLTPLPNRSDEIAMIIYTSGTTGAPKGVMLSHSNLLSNIRSVNTLMGLTSRDSILVVVPLYFIHGRMQLLTHALIGGTCVFSGGFHFPQRVADELEEYAVTGFSGVPYHFLSLLQRTDLASRQLANLRYVVVTGGALTYHQLRRLADALPRVAIHVGYGQTEASPRIANLPPADVFAKRGSCGRPVPSVEVHIVDDSGASVPHGELGEIVVSGPNVMRGYVSGDEYASGKLDRLGRLHTGDLGTMDDDGYIYLAGRRSDLIKCAGERVYPREIESVLETHPDVRECAVFGVPDESLGERIVACVVLSSTPESIGPEQLRTFCLRSLPLVRIPREFTICDALPKTGSGKIDRTLLAQRATMQFMNVA